MSNPKTPAQKTAADHMVDNKLSAEAILLITSKQEHPDVVEQRAESWVLWQSRREAREAQEARIKQEAQKKARIARDEAATQAFFQQKARDEAATQAFLKKLRAADVQTVSDAAFARLVAQGDG